MAMEIEPVRFRRDERSYFSTEPGWRLATYDEAKEGLETIKENDVLKKWDRVRLLDGWMLGPGYHFQMGNDFRSFLGYMLLIETQDSGRACAYANVELSERQKNVALLLCTDDWNYEVVYWLFNSWAKTYPMDLQDVMHGAIPFSHSPKFKKMNRKHCSLARKLGDMGPASVKANKSKYLGSYSAENILSDMIHIVKEENPAQYCPQSWVTFDIKKILPESLEPQWLQDLAKEGGADWNLIADAIWNFLFESYAEFIIREFSATCLKNIHELNLEDDFKTDDKKRYFMFTSYVLLSLSWHRQSIVHEPLTHHFCDDENCIQGMIEHVALKCGREDLPRFNETLQNNAMWRCNNQIENYHLRYKLIQFAAAGGFFSSYFEGKMDAETVSFLVYRLIDSGAHLNVQTTGDQTLLHLAVLTNQDPVLNIFLTNSQIVGLTDQKDEDGLSPLDMALRKTNMKVIATLLAKSAHPQDYYDKMDLNRLLRYSFLEGYDHIVKDLIKKGINLSAGECDEEGKTTLHLAAMCEDDKKAMEMVTLVFENNIEKETLVVKKDKRGRTALHEAALNGNKQLCEYLLKVNPRIINLKDNDGRNPIYDAGVARKNAFDVIRMLVDVYSKDVLQLNVLIDRNGLTPLHVAASVGNKEGVSSLLYTLGNRQTYWNRSKVAQEAVVEYIKKSDFLGQTALHKAVTCGEYETVKLLLEEGAHPLEERDCDGRTALHYVVKSKTEGDEKALVDLLLQKCKSNEEKWLLLWASAAGLGTADNTLSNDDPLHKFLGDKKDEIRKNLSTENLLKIAASMGNIEMTKELIARGYQIKDIRDSVWKEKLQSESQLDNVKKVEKQLERIAEQANDQPTVLDNLGRMDYAKGLAALLLNPYIKPPIVVGISGTWGMGKSSLMQQTESIMLKTAAQMALLPQSVLSSSTSELPEIRSTRLSKLGEKKCEEIKRYVEVNYEEKSIKKSAVENGSIELQDSLAKFFNNYERKYRKIFKSLAAMDKSIMFTTELEKNQESQNTHSKSVWKRVKDKFKKNHEQSKSSHQQSSADYSVVEESVPAILTVQYNAWKYKSETEALAGLAVEITRELEGIMTDAQWLSSCWRNTWKKKKYSIWIEIIFPCLLAVVLACTITWILWVIADTSEKFKHWIVPKYVCLPTAIVSVGWIVTRSIMGILKPVSTQLMSYVSFPDHTDKLGYQERVIEDVTFLKDEIGRRPCMVFEAYSWIFTMTSTLWLLFLDWLITPLLFHHTIFGKNMSFPKISAASGKNLRIIVFIDDLDRCQESVILQVLSAISLVLAVCEINVVLGIDEELIHRAIIRKYGDIESERSFKDKQEVADLAEMYLHKIIQLPLDLPDPSEEQSRKFLQGQLGIFQEQSEVVTSNKPQAIISRQKSRAPVTEAPIRRSTLWDDLESDDSENDDPERESSREITRDPEVGDEDVVLDVAPNATPTHNWPAFQQFKRQIQKVFCGKNDVKEEIAGDIQEEIAGDIQKEHISKNSPNKTSKNNYLSLIPIREMLFVRYSKGEQDAFCNFQKFATESRKLPREWKRLLTYHRLVWYIFYLTGEAKDVAGWQVQLITWIFICWEWQENMNFIIQNWNQIGTLSSQPNGPSLQMIVHHFMELDSKKSLNMNGIGHEEKEKAEETIVKDGTSTEANFENESSVREHQKPEELTKETSIEGSSEDQQRNKMVVLENLDLKIDELKKEIKELKDEFNKKIKESKDEIMKQQRQKDENWEEEKRLKRLKRWATMRSALNNYDVSMDAILSFQRFRFYCIAGHLSWPSPQQV